MGAPEQASPGPPCLFLIWQQIKAAASRSREGPSPGSAGVGPSAATAPWQTCFRFRSRVRTHVSSSSLTSRSPLGSALPHRGQQRTAALELTLEVQARGHSQQTPQVKFQLFYQLTVMLCQQARPGLLLFLCKPRVAFSRGFSSIRTVRNMDSCGLCKNQISNGSEFSGMANVVTPSRSASWHGPGAVLQGSYSPRVARGWVRGRGVGQASVE